MREYLDTPLFGVTLTVLTFVLSNFIYKKVKNPLANPILLSIISIIMILKTFNIDILTYEKGGDIISFFLGPATVVLSVPIYKKIELLKKNLIPTLIGILIGSLSGILSVLILSKLFLLDDKIILSLIPKSTTSAIAIDISKQINGNYSITLAFVLATGMIGNILGPSVLKLFNIKSKIAKGVSLGTASHAIGTAKAIELGQNEGAMSSLAIGIAGVMTVFLAPLIVNLIF